MLAIFLLRLACGLSGALTLLSPAQVAARFYRVQFLCILGLTAGAAFFLWQSANVWLLLLLGGGMVLAFGGSIAWLLEGAPGGRTLILLEVVILAASLPLTHISSAADVISAGIWPTLDDWSSAALLGTATSAMLMGHSYLVAPAMSISPLLRLLGAMFVAILLRMAVAGVELGWPGAGSAA